MLIEAGIWLGVSTFLYHSFFRKKSDREKIDLVFENIKYGFKDQLPEYMNTFKFDDKTTYLYHLPYGLIDNPQLEEILSKTLNKPVKVTMLSKLFINVYNKDIKKKYDYKYIKLPKWTIPVGYSLDGLVTHDFSTIPHMTIAGSTTWGKTVFMKMLVTHLIENTPESVEFYILDLKGGLAFNRFKKIKQVKAVAGNCKESAAVLKKVKDNIEKDMNYFKSINAENAKEAKVPKRKFILIDEAGELSPTKNTSKSDKKYMRSCQQILSHIARVSGQLGYSLLFGTQYPTAEILDRQIKANSLAKISFRLSTATQSNVAIDQSGAEKLEYPGRAIYRTVNNHIVQTPFITNEYIQEVIRRYEDDSATEETSTERGEDLITFG